MAFNPRDLAPPTRLIVYAPPDRAIFGDWERFDQTPAPPPCRTIPVTEDMRQRDIERQRQSKSTVASAWRRRVLPNRG